MAAPAPPRFVIRNTNNRGQSMFANIAISRGDRILQEEPLMVFPITPLGLYDTSTFYDRKHMYNGIGALKRHGESLDPVKRAAIMALYSPANTFQNKVQFNAWQDDRTDDGAGTSNLLVYQNLSRLNHSCRPNAIIAHNHEALVNNRKTLVGTLHALTDIPQNTEITVCYLPEPVDCLKSKNIRRRELDSGYQFDCNCEACGLPRDRSTIDNQGRARALRSFNAASATRALANGTPDDFAIRRIELWAEYIQNLQQLVILDNKLQNAYEAMSDLHMSRYEAARQLQNQVADHCVACARDGNGSWHLDRALDSLKEAYYLNLCHCGSDHIAFRENEAKIRSMALIRLRYA